MTTMTRAAAWATAGVAVLFGTVSAVPPAKPEPKPIRTTGFGQVDPAPAPVLPPIPKAPGAGQLVAALKASRVAPPPPSHEDAAGAPQPSGVGEAPPEAPAPQGGTLPPAAQAVADCESGAILASGLAVPGSFDPGAHNPTSSASGAFQFIDSTWVSTTGLPAPAAAHPLSVQLEGFLKLWADGAGRSHWAPSRHCWGPVLGY